MLSLNSRLPLTIKPHPVTSFSQNQTTKLFFRLLHLPLISYEKKKGQDVKGLREFTRNLPISVEFISNNMGRGILAKKSFAAGEVVFSEKPIITASLPYFKLREKIADPNSYIVWSKEYCSFCLDPLQRPEGLLARLPFLELYPKNEHVHCSQCETELYCSSTCRDSAWKLHHSKLCNANIPHRHVRDVRAFESLQSPNELKLLVRLYSVVVTTLERKYSSKLHSRIFSEQSDLPELLGVFGYLCTNESPTGPITRASPEQLGDFVEHLRKILYKSTERFPILFTQETLVKLWNICSLNALPISSSPELFQEYTESAQRETKKNLKMRRNQSSFISRLRAISEKFPPQISLPEGFRMLTASGGSGIYILHSMINHSCSPNVTSDISTKSGAKSVLVTTKPIQEGEEILVDYIGFNYDEPEYQDLNVRQTALLERFGFVCGCVKCLSQKSLIPSSVEGSVVPTGSRRALPTGRKSTLISHVKKKNDELMNNMMKRATRDSDESI